VVDGRGRPKHAVRAALRRSSLIMASRRGPCATAERIMRRSRMPAETRSNHDHHALAHDHFGAMAELAKRFRSALRRSRADVQPIRLSDGPRKTYPELYGKGSAPCETGTPLRLRLTAHRHVAVKRQDRAAGSGGANRPAPAQAEGHTTRPRNAQSSAASLRRNSAPCISRSDLDKEFDLMCPMNRIGTPICSSCRITASRSPTPRCWCMGPCTRRIMNNGTRKAQPDAMKCSTLARLGGPLADPFSQPAARIHGARMFSPPDRRLLSAMRSLRSRLHRLPERAAAAATTAGVLDQVSANRRTFTVQRA